MCALRMWAGACRRDAPRVDVPLVYSQDVAAVVEFRRAVSLDALPGDEMRLDGSEQRDPQVLVLDRLLAALPAIGLPFGRPASRKRRLGTPSQGES